MRIYETILQLCEEKGLSISALERKAGIGNGTIRKWRTGYPRIDSLERVAKALEISLAVLASSEQWRQ